jgi:hypothetical protein
MPRERPIIFSAPMVRALLDGTKSQSRRIIRPQPPPGVSDLMDLGSAWKPAWSGRLPDDAAENRNYRCPYGRSGDQLGVRETWRPLDTALPLGLPILYRADNRCSDFARHVGSGWRTPIFMPRWASRIDLEVLDVRAERLQQISFYDLHAKGFRYELAPGIEVDIDGGVTAAGERSLRRQFAAGWDRINGKRAGWTSNPWVWVVELQRINA